MGARWLVWWVLATACTRSTAPKARLVGEIASLGGVAGIIGSAVLTSEWSHAKQSVVVFSIVTAAGMGTYAAGELTDPANDPATETLPERHHRWAKILTARAQGAAREGKCDDVRRLEPRVRGYDPELHDFVLMRDPEVVRCLTVPEPAPEATIDHAQTAARPTGP